MTSRFRRLPRPTFVFLLPFAAIAACGGDDAGGSGPGLSGAAAAAGETSKGKGGSDGDAGTGGTGGTGGNTAKGGSGGKGGTTSKGGSGGTGGSGGKGGSTGKGGSGGKGGSTSKGGSGGTGGTTSKGGSGGTGGTDAGGSGGTGGTDAAGTGGTDAGGTGGTDAGGSAGSAGSESGGAAGSDPGPCVPEPDASFCQRYGAECGDVVAQDNCGTPKSVACGTCSATGETCGGGGVFYTCGRIETTALPGGTSAPNLLGVWAKTATEAWAVGDKGTVVRFDGSDWKAVSTGLASDALKAVWGFENQLWVSGALGFYHFDGSTWSKVVEITGPTRAIWGASATEVYAAGDLGQIYKYDGSKWANVGIGYKDTVIRGIWKDATGKVAALGDDGHTGGFNGTAWAIGCCEQTSYFALHGSGTFGVAGAQGGVEILTGWLGPFPELERPKISGATFSSINTQFQGVYVEDETRAWAVGTGGAVVHSGPTRAMTWYQVSNGGGALRAVSGAGGTTFVVGDKGAIRLYKN